MKPLILQFEELPTDKSHDYSLIEYSDVLNLSIDKKTGIPAIESASMETETFTKAGGEGADSDRDGFNPMMITETGTYANTESSDSDRDIASIYSLLETQTATRDYMESSDSDPR